jgi:hypothetical protein
MRNEGFILSLTHLLTVKCRRWEELRELWKYLHFVQQTTDCERQAVTVIVPSNSESLENIILLV